METQPSKELMEDSETANTAKSQQVFFVCLFSKKIIHFNLWHTGSSKNPRNFVMYDDPDFCLSLETPGENSAPLLCAVATTGPKDLTT